LVECLVYISLLFVVLGLAFSVFDRFQDGSRSLTRNAQDIARAMRAGERWRADVRLADAPLKLEGEAPFQALQIPSPQGTLRYEFSTNGVWRTAGDPAKKVLLLSDLKSSQIYLDQRDHVHSVRWEL